MKYSRSVTRDARYGALGKMFLRQGNMPFHKFTIYMNMIKGTLSDPFVVIELRPSTFEKARWMAEKFY